MNQAIMNAPALAGTGQSLPNRFEAAAREYFGDRYSTGESICTQHGRDESPFLPVPPQAVVFAQSTDAVVFLVNLCRHHQVILIPDGVGSSIEGSLLAVAGGVSLGL